MSLTRRVTQAGFWVAAAFVMARLASLLRLSVLAHLLVPDDFGLMALIVLVVGSLWALSDVGIGAAIIQRRNPDAAFLHTAWHLNWMRGVLLAAGCWLLAPVVAQFFARPELASWLHWASLIPLIRGMESLGGVLLQRNLDFKRRTWLDLSRETAATVTAIGVAMYWKADIQALFGGLLAGALASAAVSYLVHDYRPRLVFSRMAVRDIWRFGGHLMGAGVLIFAMTNMDDLVIGKMLGTEQLGYYGVAFTLAAILTSQLVQLFNTVILPALSEIQADIERMKRALGISARLMAGLLTPVVCGVGLAPAQVIELGFGDRWLPAVPVLLVLLAMGWVRGMASVFGPVLVARGLTAAVHRMKWIEFAVFAAAIVPAVHFLGILGAAWVLLAVYVLSLLLHIQAVERDAPGVVGAALMQMGRGLLPAGIAFAMVSIMMPFLSDIENGHRLALLVFVMIWLGMVWLMDKRFLQELRGKVMQA